MKKKGGFTLVELLVVIAIIALLMSILVPALRMAKDQATRIACSNNVKNLALSLIMYADDNNHKIPQSSGYWPWDVPRDITYKMVKYMGMDVSAIKPPPGSPPKYLPLQYSKYFYCPANPGHKRWREAYWEYSSGYRIAGYAFLWKASWNSNGANPIIGFGQDGLQPDPAKKWVDRTDVRQPSDTELVMDATLSKQINDPKYPHGNFGIIHTSYSAGGGLTADCSNHLISDVKVWGGNIGFVDYHVEWRPFAEMKHRFTVISGGDGLPIFWWW